MRILIDMVADLFHSGHVRALRHLKEAYPGASVVVALLSDEFATRWKRLPILSLAERLEIVSACRYAAGMPMK